jgi:hypothetical protein
MSNHWHTRFQDENFVYGTEPNVFFIGNTEETSIIWGCFGDCWRWAWIGLENPLMDVPSSAMGDRIFNTGDEVSFHINEKNAVKIADERYYDFKIRNEAKALSNFRMVSFSEVWMAFGL